MTPKMMKCGHAANSITKAITIREPTLSTPLVVLDAEIVERAESLLAKASELPPVTTPDQIPDADDVSKEIATLARAIEKQRKDIKAPVIALGKAIDAAAKGPHQMLTQAHRKIDDQISAVQREEDRKAREAERKRREAEERARREAEELAALEQQAATPEDLQAVEELRQEVNEETGRAWVEALHETPEPIPKSGVHSRREMVPEILNLRMLPSIVNGVQIVNPIMGAIKRLLLAGVEVPGARLVERTTTVRR